jgi:hypothetical protein
MGDKWDKWRQQVEFLADSTRDGDFRWGRVEGEWSGRRSSDGLYILLKPDGLWFRIRESNPLERAIPPSSLGPLYEAIIEQQVS